MRGLMLALGRPLARRLVDGRGGRPSFAAKKLAEYHEGRLDPVAAQVLLDTAREFEPGPLRRMMFVDGLLRGSRRHGITVAEELSREHSARLAL